MKKFTKKALKKAQKQLSSIPDRGIDEEYYADSIETYNEFNYLRRRANKNG